MRLVTNDEFRKLFARALEESATNAEAKLQKPISREFEVELHGTGRPQSLATPDEAMAILYLGPDLYYRIIDVAVIRAKAHKTTIFVRASGHAPGRFEESWNQPLGNGPFKQLLAEEIRTDDGLAP
jgi:hypothetical protein